MSEFKLSAAYPVGTEKQQQEAARQERARVLTHHYEGVISTAKYNAVTLERQVNQALMNGTPETIEKQMAMYDANKAKLDHAERMLAIVKA